MKDESVLGHILSIIGKVIGIVIYSITKTTEKILMAFNGWLNSKLKK